MDLHVETCVNRHAQFENIDCWTEDKDNVIEEEADDDLWILHCERLLFDDNFISYNNGIVFQDF